jgi:hypothetical protein
MRTARTLCVTIDRPAGEVYDFVRDPANLPKWAAGIDSGAKVRFVEHNALGVLDHWVDTPQGEVHVPMRVIANGGCSEFVFTLLRGPGMTDEIFDRDARAVERDLAALKRVLEG